MLQATHWLTNSYVKELNTEEIKSILNLAFWRVINTYAYLRYSVCEFTVFSMRIYDIQYAYLRYSVCELTVFSMRIYDIQYANLRYSVCVFTVFSMRIYGIQYAYLRYSVCVFTVFSMRIYGIQCMTSTWVFLNVYCHYIMYFRTMVIGVRYFRQTLVLWFRYKHRNESHGLIGKDFSYRHKTKYCNDSIVQNVWCFS